MGTKGHMVYIGDSRRFDFLQDSSIDLVITSPPYWHIKDYKCGDQIGHGQNLHSYLKDLYLVWKECIRALRPGRRICINIGDQFARSKVYGRYKIIPLHSEIISQMERLEMDYMGSIIWNKRTKMNTSGGAVIMGSYPYPPNGIVEIDYEYIMIFKKPGPSLKVEKEIKEVSKMTKEEWKELHSGHWTFGGARQVSHEAMYPLELPTRLMKMFSFKGEKVLDPFLGSGTTVIAAENEGRIGIGIELNEDFIPIMKERIGEKVEYNIEKMKEFHCYEHDSTYEPNIKNAEPPVDTFEERKLERVKGINEKLELEMSDGRVIRLGGLEITEPVEAMEYLEKFVSGKEISIEIGESIKGDLVFLKNRIYINGELLKRGYASVIDGEFPARKRLIGILKRSMKDH